MSIRSEFYMNTARILANVLHKRLHLMMIGTTVYYFSNIHSFVETEVNSIIYSLQTKCTLTLIIILTATKHFSWKKDMFVLRNSRSLSDLQTNTGEK